eukprot:scaffold72_cov92-Isochrysis_galbana.AAC.1
MGAGLKRMPGRGGGGIPMQCAGKFSRQGCCGCVLRPHSRSHLWRPGSRGADGVAQRGSRHRHHNHFCGEGQLLLELQIGERAALVGGVALDGPSVDHRHLSAWNGRD